MDDAERSALEMVLRKAEAKKAEAEAVIAWVTGELGGRPAPASQEEPAKGDAAAQGGGHGGDPLSMVSEGEFFGMSAPKAAVALLERVGRSRPLKTEEIFDAITRGGVSIASKDGLYRGLFRDPKFLRVGKSLWGLSTWYPAAARKAAKTAQDAEADAEVADLVEPGAPTAEPPTTEPEEQPREEPPLQAVS